MTNINKSSPGKFVLKKHTGLKRIGMAFINTKNGLLWMLYNEPAFRQEALLLAITLPLVMILDLDNPSRALMVGSILIILIVEVLNTGLEKVVDRISYEYHELSGLAKDCGSAAVFLSFMLAGLVWAVVLFN